MIYARRRMLIAAKMGASKLPVEFQEVEYIESTGTQFIDTGFKPNQDTRVVCDFQLTEIKASFVFGARDSSTSTSPRSYTFNIGSAGVFQTTYNTQTANVFGNADLLRHTVDKDKNITTFEGIEKISTYAAFTSPNTLTLFACYQTGGYGYLPSKMKLYSCQIYDNENLIHDYVPCYRKSDGLIGLYDRVEKIQKINQGTGTFGKGGDV